MAKTDAWVAGVYIREDGISAIIGKIVGTSAKDVVKLPDAKIPKTEMRDKYRVPDVSCSGKTPAQAIAESANILINILKDDAIELRTIHVACFGGFKATDYHSRASHETSGYGVLTNVSPYNAGWHDLPIYEIYFRRFLSAGLNPIISVGTNSDASAFGEYVYDVSNVPSRQRESYNSSHSLAALNFSRTINIGIVKSGILWEGENHPLLSVMRPARFRTVDGEGIEWIDRYEGNCEFHGDCLEGLIGANALSERTGMIFEDIPDNHQVWDIVAYYIAQACISVVSILMPTTIMLTGRSIRQRREDTSFSDKMIGRVRYYFYSYLHNKNGSYSPSYEAVLSEEFIRLPRSPKRKSKDYPQYGLPGRHGALKLAAKAYADPKNIVIAGEF